MYIINFKSASLKVPDRIAKITETIKPDRRNKKYLNTCTSPHYHVLFTSTFCHAIRIFFETVGVATTTTVVKHAASARVLIVEVPRV